MNAVPNRFPPVEVPARLSNIETETALIGMLLIENRAVDIVADMLDPSDFAEPLLGRIYERIVQVVSAGGQATSITLKSDFADDPAMAELGGGFLAQLTAQPGVLLLRPRPTAKLLKELSRQRQLYADLRGLTASIENGEAATVEALVERADAAFSKAADTATVSRGTSLAKAFDKTIERIRLERSGEAPQGVKVAGLDDLNQLFGRVLRPGNLIVLAGRPGMGKTALLVSTMLASARAGNGTAVFSLEMDVDGLTVRAISDLVYEFGDSISFDRLQEGAFTAFDEKRIADARDEIADWPLELRYEPGLTLASLARQLRRIKREMAARGQTLRLALVDYLQLMSGSNTKQNRSEQVGELSRGLKVLAGELGICIIALSQLSRKCEEREDKRPLLSDLRESGAIEQDADAVGFVYRPQYYLEQCEPAIDDKKRAAWEVDMEASRNRMELIAAKVRQGKTGRRLLHYFLDNQAVRGSRHYQDTNR